MNAADIEREAVTSIGLAYYAMRESEGSKSMKQTKDGPEKLQSLQKLSEQYKEKMQEEHGLYSPAQTDTPFDAACKEILRKYDIDAERAAKIH